jgi:hypothetical protein
MRVVEPSLSPERKRLRRGSDDARCGRPAGVSSRSFAPRPKQPSCCAPRCGPPRCSLRVRASPSPATGRLLLWDEKQKCRRSLTRYRLRVRASPSPATGRLLLWTKSSSRPRSARTAPTLAEGGPAAPTPADRSSQPSVRRVGSLGSCRSSIRPCSAALQAPATVISASPSMNSALMSLSLVPAGSVIERLNAP